MPSKFPIDDIVEAQHPDAYCHECGGVRSHVYDEVEAIYLHYGLGEPEPCSCVTS